MCVVYSTCGQDCAEGVGDGFYEAFYLRWLANKEIVVPEMGISMGVSTSMGLGLGMGMGKDTGTGLGLGLGLCLGLGLGVGVGVGVENWLINSHARQDPEGSL